MDVSCTKCRKSRWVGLVYCPHCGVLAVETPTIDTSNPAMQMVVDAVLEPALPQDARLFGAFGLLLAVGPYGAGEVIAPVGGHGEGSEWATHRHPLSAEICVPDAEVIAVGRWLVARTGDELRALPAPMLLVAAADRRWTTICRGPAGSPPERCRKAIRAFGPGGAASVARLGEHLVAVSGESSGRSVVRVFAPSPPGAHEGQQFEEIYKTDMQGEWLLDRGGWSGADRLVLHSEKRVGFLQAQGREVTLRLCEEECVRQIYPASTVLTDHELLWLGVAGNNEYQPFSWEYRTAPHSAPRTVGGLADRMPDGIEPTVQNGQRSACARIGGRFYPYSRPELAFSTAALPARQISNQPPSTPGAIVYEAEHQHALRVRFADMDLPLSGGEPLEARSETVEGGRVWLVGTHRRDRAPWLRIFDRVPA